MPSSQSLKYNFEAVEISWLHSTLFTIYYYYLVFRFGSCIRIAVCLPMFSNKTKIYMEDKLEDASFQSILLRIRAVLRQKSCELEEVSIEFPMKKRPATVNEPWTRITTCNVPSKLCECAPAHRS